MADREPLPGSQDRRGIFWGEVNADRRRSVFAQELCYEGNDEHIVGFQMGCVFVCVCVHMYAVGTLV